MHNRYSTPGRVCAVFWLCRARQKPQMPGFGAQFYNVSKARIYGAEVSTNGVYTFNPNTTLSYNLGYVFIEPEDADYKKKNEEEATYDDPMQMKEKSNTSKYLKYRQKHTVKAILDFQWKRLTLGTNIVWKQKNNQRSWTTCATSSSAT